MLTFYNYIRAAVTTVEQNICGVTPRSKQSVHALKNHKILMPFKIMQLTRNHLYLFAVIYRLRLCVYYNVVSTVTF